MQRYRNELKFLISQGELEIIKGRLQGVMQPDRYQRGECYHIRSLYFDDEHDSCMRENEAGIDERCKYRIRIYNKSSDRISLELKSKKHGLTNKRSSLIDEVQCLKYMEDEPTIITEQMPVPVREFELMRKMKRMHPVCIVEYERTAYVYPVGNVRITFDRNIEATQQTKSFLGETKYLKPILPVGNHILEVKYDELLPDFIAQLIEIGTLERIAFSKYYLARISR